MKVYELCYLGVVGVMAAMVLSTGQDTAVAVLVPIGWLVFLLLAKPDVWRHFRGATRGTGDVPGLESHGPSGAQPAATKQVFSRSV